MLHVIWAGSPPTHCFTQLLSGGIQPSAVLADCWQQAEPGQAQPMDCLCASMETGQPAFCRVVHSTGPLQQTHVRMFVRFQHDGLGGFHRDEVPVLEVLTHSPKEYACHAM